MPFFMIVGTGQPLAWCRYPVTSLHDRSQRLNESQPVLFASPEAH
jgi:hypothetical protein